MSLELLSYAAFFLTMALSLFVVVHVVMVATSGFRSRMRGMITGCVDEAASEEGL